MGQNIFTYITGKLIIAVIIFIVFMIVLTGGGFSALWNIGNLLSKIPAFVWIGLLIFWLIGQIMN